MATLANEAVSGGSSAMLPAERLKGATNHRRKNAQAAEVPVTVQASRYAGPTERTQNFPAMLDEDTRTVVVFHTGALVRLSAAIAIGETVVLTKRQTGNNVICRVSNVKAQVGVSNYVNLEFTELAPGFWGDDLPLAPERRPEFAEPYFPPVVDLHASLPPVASPDAAEVRPKLSRKSVSLPVSEIVSAVEAITQFLSAAPGSTRKAPPETAEDFLDTELLNADALQEGDAIQDVHDDFSTDDADDMLAESNPEDAALFMQRYAGSPIASTETLPAEVPAKPLSNILSALAKSRSAPLPQPADELKLNSGGFWLATQSDFQIFSQNKTHSDGHFAANPKTWHSRQTFLTIAAGVVLLLLGCVGEFVFGHRGVLFPQQSGTAANTSNAAPRDFSSAQPGESAALPTAPEPKKPD